MFSPVSEVRSGKPLGFLSLTATQEANLTFQGSAGIRSVSATLPCSPGKSA